MVTPGRLMNVLRHETIGFHPRLDLIQLLMLFLPPLAGSRLRRELYRRTGVQIGHGTVIMGRMRLTGMGNIAAQLRIGRNCVLNELVTFNLGETVVLEDDVTIGMEALFLTVSHDTGSPKHRAGRRAASPIFVGRGAWIAARSILLAGVTVGSGAVVGAGSVVTRDIPPNVFAAGTPARVIRPL